MNKTTVEDPAASQPVPLSEPLVRADALAYLMYERSDVTAMRRFLEDFGFLPCGPAAGGAHFFRTYGSHPYAVEVRESDRDAFIGFGFSARSRVELERFADAARAKIEPIPGPGGGDRVRLKDPNGFQVDLIHGFKPAAPVPTRDPITQANTPGLSPRRNAGVRTEVAPSPVMRLGHIVLHVPSFEETAAWYARHFGILPTDLQTLEDGTPVLGFYRLDRGQEPADHHTLAFATGMLPSPEAKMLHVSTETLDIDAIGQGQQFLRARGWEHFWGMGRHLLGSQFFDYWKDPMGDEWEHYADGDVMTADYPTGHYPMTLGGLWAWGEDLPQSMRPPAVPPDAPPLVRKMVEALRAPARPWWSEAK